MSETIYKICSEAEWQRALASGSYTGSADDARDGFIHFSLADQLRATAAKYFSGRTDLLLVAIDPAALGEALRYEPSRGGALFPHLYAALPVRCALWTAPLKWNGETHEWPEQVRATRSGD